MQSHLGLFGSVPAARDAALGSARRDVRSIVKCIVCRSQKVAKVRSDTRGASACMTDGSVVHLDSRRGQYRQERCKAFLLDERLQRGVIHGRCAAAAAQAALGGVFLARKLFRHVPYFTKKLRLLLPYMFADLLVWLA